MRAISNPSRCERWLTDRSHALRGNASTDALRSALWDAERPWLHSHAERGNDRTLLWLEGVLTRRGDVQGAVRQQLTQLDHLLDPQGKTSSCAFQIKGQFVGHDIDRRQGFAEVGQQAFQVRAFRHGEQLARWWSGFFGFGVEVKGERAVGGFVEFFGVAFGGLGVILNMV